MDAAAQKERALAFLDQMNHPDSSVLDGLIAQDFEFEFMMRAPGVKVQKRDEFLKWFPKIMKSWFPNGLNMKFDTVIAEGPCVAVQATADTTAGNGKHYSNRYHFFCASRATASRRHANITIPITCARRSSRPDLRFAASIN